MRIAERRVWLDNAAMTTALRCLILAALLVPPSAQAHVSLSPANAAPGARLDVHFRVGHGCNGAPTIALTVTIPPGVTNVTPAEQQGWSIATVRQGARMTAVTWKGGSLAADKPGEFVVAMTLPAAGAQLAFPATQVCRNGEEAWNELPMAGMTMTHPAPVLLLAAAAPAAPATLAVSNAWFRALPSSQPAGGYFTLRNNGAKPATLTGAQSPACGMLMMHKSENKGGMAGMEMVPALPVAAGASIAFTPGSYHLMCTDPRPAMKPGASVKVTLQFQDGTQLPVDFAVRNAAGR
jgi:copper(I)-binding protein